VLSRYDDYWGGWADVRHYDTVRLSIILEAADQQQALDDGSVDIALSIPLEKIESYRDNPDFTVLEEPSFFNYVGLLNTQREPLNNPLVRQALSHATPYQDIIDAAAHGFGTQSRGPVPAGVFPYSPDVPQYTYDIAAARDLLAQAEWQEGFPMEITFDSDNEFQAAFVPLLRDSYGQIGVDVTLTPMPFDQQWERAQGDPANRQDMFLAVYWPTYSDAGSDNLYSLFSSMDGGGFFNLSYWSNAQYDALIDEASTLSATDRATAQARYVEAMQLLVDEAPGVFLFDSKFVIPFPNRIAGYEYNLNYPFAHFFYPLHPAE
jgi:peptide/nickel transport system substrate-binding protein